MVLLLTCSTLADLIWAPGLVDSGPLTRASWHQEKQHTSGCIFPISQTDFNSAITLQANLYQHTYTTLRSRYIYKGSILACSHFMINTLSRASEKDCSEWWWRRISAPCFASLRNYPATRPSAWPHTHIRARARSLARGEMQKLATIRGSTSLIITARVRIIIKLLDCATLEQKLFPRDFSNKSCVQEEK